MIPDELELDVFWFTVTTPYSRCHLIRLVWRIFITGTKFALINNHLANKMFQRSHVANIYVWLSNLILSIFICNPSHFLPVSLGFGGFSTLMVTGYHCTLNCSHSCTCPAPVYFQFCRIEEHHSTTSFCFFSQPLLGFCTGLMAAPADRWVGDEVVGVLRLSCSAELVVSILCLWVSAESSLRVCLDYVSYQSSYCVRQRRKVAEKGESSGKLPRGEEGQ